VRGGWWRVQEVGCDGVVGAAGKQFDACLVCGDDSRRCVTVHGTINTQHLRAGMYRSRASMSVAHAPLFAVDIIYTHFHRHLSSASPCSHTDVHSVPSCFAIYGAWMLGKKLISFFFSQRNIKTTTRHLLSTFVRQ